MTERDPKLLRNLLMERIRQVCMGKLPGTLQDLAHLAGAINKSIELECRVEELKMAKKKPKPSEHPGDGDSQR